jgi:2-oxoglutarate dehydrogenase E2 component (dihydrolipoamide succinyltransferase)
MPIEQVKVPQAGESITEVTISRWLQADGAYVKLDDPIVELGTDKATQELPAPVAGVLKHRAKEDDTVAVDAVIAEIDTDAKTPASGTKPAETKPAESKPSESKPTEPKPAEVKPPDHAKPAEPKPPQAKPKPEPGPPSARPQTSGKTTREPMSLIRKRIAERLLASQNATATLTTFNEADLSTIVDFRSKYNEQFEKKHGVKLGFMSMFVKAAVAALKEFPLVNARIDGGDILYQHFYDIGVAVSTEKGLMVPVLRGAEQLNFADIEKQIADLARRAREGKIAVTDLEGGTFTITNGGSFGSMMSTPILNPPQAAILGLHAITKRAVVVNDEIAIRPMMYLALSYDHRLIDGREAVQFLVRIKQYVENPERLLLEI